MQSTMMQKPLANRAAQPMRARAGAKPVVSARALARASRRCVVPFAAATAQAPVKASNELDEKCVNTIRFLAIDAVNKAKSGHPGLPMGCAPMTYVLFNEIMKFNPKNPKFFNRDRFVLSAGHGSMLQYAMLHLCGYDSVSMDDIKQFRQWGSATPGHPENFITSGVEVTTGPLGQGICNAVGLALAEANLAARFNKPDSKLVDHYTYVIMGDGCNMEGISTEACSLAGHWGLGKLIVLWDDNKISIDGHTDIAFTEDVSKRFESLGWHTMSVTDGNTDFDSLRNAINEAKSVTDKPTMIKVSTLIGYGSPNKANSYAAHGAPLGPEETTLTRENLGWKYGEFEVPDEVYEHMKDSCIQKGSAVEAAWIATAKAYAEKYPAEWKEFQSIVSGELPAGWEAALPSFTPEDKALATRQHSQTMLNALAPVLPGLIGGSADLASSNLTLMKMFGDFQKGSYGERNVRFGVREHAMGAICNGLALHSPGFIPYCATFFIFTDYMRAAMRMSALSEVGVVYVMTHDSIGLGEDGPTHQPVEHLASFRAMPNMLMLRPAGGNETAGAYKVAVQNRKRPSTIALSRQNIDNLPGCTVDAVAKGAYIVKDCEGTPEVIVIGTGSELPMAYQAVEKLAGEGIKARLVSMPCWELFQEQSAEYKDSVLPPSVTARVSVEAGSSFGWREFIGTHGVHVGIDGFGASAPAPVLFEKYGITLDAVVGAAKKVAGK